MSLQETHYARKIALVGAACVGKTTLLNELKRRFHGDSQVAFVDEVGRTYFTEHQVDPAEVFSVPIQAEIQSIILEKEQAAASTHPDVIICDRSVIDSPVHVQAHGSHEDADALVENVESWLASYYIFVLLDPADVLYETDAVRRESSETRQNIHQTFVVFLAEHDLPHELLSGTLEERVARVEEIIHQ